MTTHKVNRKQKQWIALLAIILLLPALYIFFIWLDVFSQDLSQAQKISAFTARFPFGMNDHRIIIYISMASCLAAMILAAKSFKQRQLPLRVAMWLTVMIAALIFLLDIFQLF